MYEIRCDNEWCSGIKLRYVTIDPGEKNACPTCGWLALKSDGSIRKIQTPAETVEAPATEKRSR